jgi:multidrug efflux pump subunit AcrA (membrane-fusion protein)
MKPNILKSSIALVAALIVIVAVVLIVHRYRNPQQMDVIAAQSMDMSSMRAPVGSALVDLASVRIGSVDSVVTYSGTVKAFNEEDVAARIEGRVLDLPVYPGDAVQAGELVARLDSAEVGAKADQAQALAEQAAISHQVALLTAHEHHQAALEQAQAGYDSALQSVVSAREQAQAASAAIPEAQAMVASAQANVDYWATEIGREKRLADAGAVSKQEYQQELAQAQAATAALDQARAKVRESTAAARAANAEIATRQKSAEAAEAAHDMAIYDISIAHSQARQEGAAEEGAEAAAREADVVVGYTRIQTPASGVVTDRPVSPGTLVQPGTVLLRIAQIDRVRVQANVSVSDLGGIGPGSAVTILVQGSKIAARVSSVFPSADPQARTAVVEAVLANPGHRLVPGAFVTMKISRGASAPGPLAPAESVVSEGGTSTVWVARAEEGAATRYQCEKCRMYFSAADAKKDGYHDPMDGGRLLPVATDGSSGLAAHQVTVRTGASDGEWTQILSGDLHEGDQVVRTGISGLSEGVRVTQNGQKAEAPASMPGMKM